MCQFNNVVVYIYFHLQWRQRNSHFPIWCQKLHQRGRLFEVSIQLRRRWICVCVLKECLNLEKIGLSLISSFIRTSSKAFSTSFSKNSLMIMEPSLSTFGSSLSPHSLWDVQFQCHFALFRNGAKFLAIIRTLKWMIFYSTNFPLYQLLLSEERMYTLGTILTISKAG